VLGLLSLRDWTTYELAKQVQRSLHWFWPRAERKLYDEPKRLVTDGLATASAGSTGKRPKTTYAITPAGRTALAAWLDEPSVSPTTEFEGLVKVFFADAGSIEQLRATLDRIVADSVERVEELVENLEVGLNEPRFPGRLHVQVLCVGALVAQELALLRWAREARAEVETWSDVAAPQGHDFQARLASLVAECRAAVA
jgi:DNA-binding PadR family transcriptional regulator